MCCVFIWNKSELVFVKNIKFFQKIKQTVGNDFFQNSQIEKDLGVTFDCELNFTYHIHEITNKATKILGILKQTVLFYNKRIFLLLYKSFTKPHLEYPSIIWYSQYKYQSISVERVQRRATNLLMETRHITYTQRLEY